MAVKKTPEQIAADVEKLEAFFERKNRLANAPALRMEPGQRAKGPIIGIASRTSDYGTYPVVTIEVNGQPTTLHAFHQIVQERLKELKPQKGDILFVEYAGEREKLNPTEDEIKRGRTTYHMYNLDTDASLLAAEVENADYQW